MPYTLNPITGQMETDPSWNYYVRSEIDAALANKLDKNSVTNTFTTVDWKTVTVSQWRITSIV